MSEFRLTAQGAYVMIYFVRGLFIARINYGLFQNATKYKYRRPRPPSDATYTVTTTRTT